MTGQALRILVLGVNFAPETTGIAPYTTALVRGLADCGHDVRVITSFPHYPDWRVERLSLGDVEALPGAAVTRVRHYVPARPDGLRRLAFELSFGFRLALSRWHRPDVVLCVSPALFGAGLALVRARVGRRKTVGLIVQDLYSRGIVETGAGGARLGGFMRRVESVIARSADGVSVIHPRFKNSVVRDLGVPEGRVTVIRNWTHVGPATPFDRDSFRASLGWLPEDAVVLHSGAMGIKQALENVVEAGRLADEGGRSVRFVLLGNGSQRDRLLMHAEGVRSVQFLDRLDDQDYAKALRAADVLLVNERPGVSDMAVPSKLTSYFSAGRPVVAAAEASGATAEEIDNAGAGVVVPPGEPALLLNAVQSLMARSDTAELGESAQRYCETVLSEQRAIEQYDAWVRVLHAEGRSKRD